MTLEELIEIAKELEHQKLIINNLGYVNISSFETTEERIKFLARFTIAQDILSELYRKYKKAFREYVDSTKKDTLPVSQESKGDI